MSRLLFLEKPTLVRGVETLPLQHTIDAANRTGVRTALETSKEIKSQKPLAKVKPMDDGTKP